MKKTILFGLSLLLLNACVFSSEITSVTDPKNAPAQTTDISTSKEDQGVGTLNTTSSNQSNTEFTLNTTPYTNAENGFIISYPVEWKINHDLREGRKANFVNPIADKVSSTTQSAWLDIYTEPLLPNEFSKITEFTQKANKEGFTNYVEIKKEKITIDDVEGLLLEFTTDQALFHYFQVMIGNNDTYYVITARALASEWPRYQEIFLASINSFKSTPIPLKLADKPYLNTKNKFQISYPYGWDTDPVENKWRAVMFVNNATGFENNWWTASVRIAVIKAPGADFEQFMKDEKLGLKEDVDNFVIMEEKDADVNGLKAKLLLTTLTEEEDPYQAIYQYVQKGDQIYLVIAQSDSVVFPKYQSLFNEVLQSFRVN